MQAIADTKEQIREMIDNLPQEELHAVRRYIEFVSARLEEDEILSPEAIAALDEARESLKRGERGLDHEDFRHELGF